ncbi:cytochrome P450 7A1 [Patella vulgata]|uniref:cytochrome P450 7A1 n=1 Tax=Patella vulgata TaxID=6465 RepID=UPI0021803822|nr:cytochrome P450 7A1 [Patella vulgata]XP_050413303.1 cytochrome P450 7A1 [Patella vulgata]XP_050413304.1 cytochrome P450 7A1 [Patella vulgata]
MVAVTVYLAATVVGLTFAYFKYIHRRRRLNEPEIVPGNIIWGNGADFAEHAVNFLHRCQKKFGDIFTIRLLNQYLTMVMDPHSYENLAREKAFDFDPIQRQVNHNVFNFELVDARKMLSEAGKKVNGRFLTTGMKNFSDNLKNAFQKVTNIDVNGNIYKTEGDNWGQDGLRDLTSKTLFSALFYTIFGQGEANEEFEPQVFYKNFDNFHKYFNYLWLGLPVKMFPKALTALNVLSKQPSSEEMLKRPGVSEYIKFSTEFMKANNQTEQDIVGHNLVFLHVNYNTFRLSFWLLYHILEDKKTFVALQQEVNDLIESQSVPGDDNGSPLGITIEEFDKLPILDSIIKETLRVTSGVFMVRYISKDTEFEMDNGQKVSVREGDRVAMYPPAIHKDPEIFEDPEVFKHDRFVDAKFYKNGKELKNPLVAFGSLCPGKKYSLLQTKWFLVNLVNSFDIALLEGESTQCDVNYYGHEILPPTHDVQVQYRLKEKFRELEFIARRQC